jgi:hypothetical protein
MAKIKYTARLNGEIVGTRNSDRIYTHAIVTWTEGVEPTVATWCGRPDLARNEQSKRNRDGWTAEIVPVEGVFKGAPMILVEISR